MKGKTFIAVWILLFTTNSADASHSGQSSYLWFINILKYCSSSWFILSICLSICGWNTVDNLISISNILFSSFINSAMNWGLLSDTTLSGNLCSFYILSLNNLAKPSANVSSVVATKCVILDNLLQTTRIASFPATTGNFVIKSTVRWVHGFSGTSLNFSFPTVPSILFFIL